MKKRPKTKAQEKERKNRSFQNTSKTIDNERLWLNEKTSIVLPTTFQSILSAWTRLHPRWLMLLAERIG